MTRATMMMRRILIAAAFAACGPAGTAQAGLVTDLFQFNTLSSDGGTVSDSASGPITITPEAGPSAAATPEPATIVMAATAATMGLTGVWRRRKAHQDKSA